MRKYASDSIHYMPSQITVHMVTCVSRVELYHKIGQIFIISMVLFIKRNELRNFFSILILLINTIICKNIYILSWVILAHDMYLVIYCLFSVIKLDLVNCVTQEAGDELSRGNCEAPTAHHADSSM